MIYIASPYTHDSASARQSRYEAVLAYTKLQMRMGKIVFSPIVYGHQFALEDKDAIPFEYWKPFNEEMLLRSDELHVLRLDGWNCSKGVIAEMKLAFSSGIRVTTVKWRDEWQK